MEKLTIDFQQERPGDAEINDMWNFVTLTQLTNWTNAADLLRDNIAETHWNEGIQLHKYKVTGNKCFEWFAVRNGLQQINFLKNILEHKGMNDYHNDLEIPDGNPSFKIERHRTDLYDLPGELSRIMGLGGAYHNIDAQLAWTVATNFVKEEFENRFDEFNMFNIVHENAGWFYNFVWDISIVLFDRRKYELVFIDITDMD